MPAPHPGVVRPPRHTPELVGAATVLEAEPRQQRLNGQVRRIGTHVPISRVPEAVALGPTFVHLGLRETAVNADSPERDVVLQSLDVTPSAGIDGDIGSNSARHVRQAREPGDRAFAVRMRFVGNVEHKPLAPATLCDVPNELVISRRPGTVVVFGESLESEHLLRFACPAAGIEDPGRVQPGNTEFFKEVCAEGVKLGRVHDHAAVSERELRGNNAHPGRDVVVGQERAPRPEFSLVGRAVGLDPRPIAQIVDRRQPGMIWHGKRPDTHAHGDPERLRVGTKGNRSCVLSRCRVCRHGDIKPQRLSFPGAQFNGTASVQGDQRVGPQPCPPVVAAMGRSQAMGARGLGTGVANGEIDGNVVNAVDTDGVQSGTVRPFECAHRNGDAGGRACPQSQLEAAARVARDMDRDGLGLLASCHVLAEHFHQGIDGPGFQSARRLP